MAEIKITQTSDPDGDPCAERRLRGRPQVRPDCDTRQLIYEAARHEFSDNGYAATSIESVARRAGVSTKTLYRLIPNKAALFEGMTSDRIDRFLSEINLEAIDHAEIDEALYAALMACADLALDKEVVALQSMVLQESGKFSDLAGAFYRNGIQRTVTALADWLTMQQSRGLMKLDDAEEVAGMLLGMVADAPRRATMFGGLPLPSRPQIEARVRKCVALFLRGYRAA
ncbi:MULTISPECIES: TetR/AcrR family transcriptional regulator [Bradyrhizobium]|jgi:AcrR family transcriptional regulator|uniref:Transcriptional regulator, TetR family n=2 Tax=Bradyrhizobium TaxID=374 RepID=A0ABY0PK83_9BRAD|nr:MULTISPECIES: TetR/AcrR family transcriptional regulator [Bradyrhizobium]SDI56141.1 transcriptional regulator, TetR family [Bradyrhizobium ottawaense]SED41378.1 transcriptional regulator, TetR family [Bradyrhizobium lablabi]SHL42226.1 transcriptional regulator, TetR family [Bradyrhizobium lablabi]